MILKASERSGARNLASHLMNTRDNEHVELHELRGFVAEDLDGALQEAHAISRGTRCKNFLFSLSLSPPERADVPDATFEAAIEQIEQELGLTDQPRAIVFHEKEGRRHAHAVWSRIDPVEMKAIQLSHYKRKLNEIARQLYLEHGWEMPEGFKDRRSRNPLSFTLAEWQQAKRTGRDPKALKALAQECWKASDTGKALQQALEERGLFLARGDRRGVVALNIHGEVYALARLCGVKAKDVKGRLSDVQNLPSMEERKAWLAERMSSKLKALVKTMEAEITRSDLALDFQRGQMVERHRNARTALKSAQAQRWQAEERERAARLPRGFKGLWSWITGATKKLRHQNALDIAKAEARDGAEKQALIRDQLGERRGLQKRIRHQRDVQREERAALERDIAQYLVMGGALPAQTKDHPHHVQQNTKDNGYDLDQS